MDFATIRSMNQPGGFRSSGVHVLSQGFSHLPLRKIPPEVYEAMIQSRKRWRGSAREKEAETRSRPVYKGIINYKCLDYWFILVSKGLPIRFICLVYFASSTDSVGLFWGLPVDVGQGSECSCVWFGLLVFSRLGLLV